MLFICDLFVIYVIYLWLFVIMLFICDYVIYLWFMLFIYGYVDYLCCDFVDLYV